MTIQMGIVEDSPSTLDVLKLMYRSRSEFDVIGSASSREEAIQMVKEKGLELVSVDIQLGEDDGIALCQELRTIRPDLYIVMCSITAEKETRALAEAAGANYFLPKPFQSSDLRNVIRAYRKSRSTTLSCKIAESDAWVEDLLAAL